MGTVIPFRLRDRSGRIPPATPQPAPRGPLSRLDDIEVVAAWRQFLRTEGDFDTPEGARLRAHLEMELRARGLPASST
jgi:hypothetical protein